MRERGFDVVRTPVPVYVSTVAQARKWAAYFRALQALGVDTETTGLDVVRDRVKFGSLACEEERICFPVRLLPEFADVIEDASTEKRLTNAKYDKHLLANHDVTLRGHIMDTADMDFVIDENREGDHGLKSCALDYLGLRMTPFKEVFGDIGSVDDEVATMCEIHDILELHDDEGEVEVAEKLARELLLRLGRVSGSPELLKQVRRLHLSLRADDCTLTARQVISVAEDFGLVAQHSGTNRHVSEFFALLGCPDELPVKERKSLVDYTMASAMLREVTEIVYEGLVAQTGIPDNPIGFLREKTCDYSSLDAWASFMLVDVMRERLAQPDMEMVTEAVRAGTAKPRLLLQHFEENRVPFLRTLWCMERRGFKINVEGTKPYAKDMQAIIDEAERNITDVLVRKHGFSYAEAMEFNSNSADQLRDVLFSHTEGEGWSDPFGHTPWKWTGGGASGVKEPSTAKAVLEDLSGKGDELSTIILKHRQFRKLKTDYMEGLPKWVDRCMRIHTVLKSTGAVSWRISCVDGSTVLETSAGAFAIQDLDLQKNQNVTIMTHEGRQRRILDCFPKGEEEMFEVTLATGEQITCTMKHRFLTQSGWRHLHELQEGDEVLRLATDEDPPS